MPYVPAGYKETRKKKIYKSILKPMWSYGVALWGTAAKSRLDRIQRFQSKTLNGMHLTV